MSLSMAAAGSSIGRRWTPLELGTALTMWVDADDADTVTLVSGGVSEWNDKSGNGRNMTQGTASYRPTRATNVQNGLAVIRFDGSNDFLDTTSSGSTAQPYSWAGVAKFDATNNIRRLWQGKNDAGNIEANGGTWVMFAGTAAQFGTVSTSFNVIVPTYNGSSSTLYVNGSVAGSSLAVGTGYPTSFRFGAYGGLTPPIQPFQGDIGEVLFIAGSLAAADRERVEGYLAHRWGLTASLPSGHPYKNIQP